MDWFSRASDPVDRTSHRDKVAHTTAYSPQPRLYTGSAAVVDAAARPPLARAGVPLADRPRPHKSSPNTKAPAESAPPVQPQTNAPRPHRRTASAASPSTTPSPSRSRAT